MTNDTSVHAQIMACNHWIFDMDGTLTVAVHDFDAIREQLGLPTAQPILEALAALPSAEAGPLWRQLDEIELELARSARAMDGVAPLLEDLHARGRKLGIVTRNSLTNARETLQACGLLDFFDERWIMDRDASAPKPQPDALLKLMAAWNAPPEDVVMVGDFLFDLQAGRAAGVATVYVDYERSERWSAHADLQVTRLDQLLAQA